MKEGSLLEARDVVKIYKNGAKELRVLKGIDIKIKRGEFVSILGPSAAGKSPLLHILGGLDEPTDGVVLLEGENIYKLSDKRRAEVRNKKIGFVFQFYHLLPEFSAFENIMLPAFISAKRKAQSAGAKERAMELLELVGLKDRIGHKPNQLSGGEQQRVAVVRALVNAPELLLCDEPTGNLDSESGKGLIGLLDKLHKERQTTIVVVTHEDQIAKKADRVLYMKDGKLQENVV
ncbi:MAG: ABC transporter ATP-binding protein [Candidatus Omnitrophica bacterium]|nr:ABC transporter ATP-binding protein [Candidatus Omnitrophota bacterium]